LANQFANGAGNFSDSVFIIDTVLPI
jgi:hypothetical protein